MQEIGETPYQKHPYQKHALLQEKESCVGNRSSLLQKNWNDPNYAKTQIHEYTRYDILW